VIFQLQDDHSRLAVASLVAPGETSQAAIDVFDRGVAARGVPQRLLTDNGAAPGPSRRGVTGRLVEHVRSLGVEPITGKPHHPTTSPMTGVSWPPRPSPSCVLRFRGIRGEIGPKKSDIAAHRPRGRHVEGKHRC